MKIIAAIDILHGKCVRLSKGDYNSQTIYNEDPLEVALAFEAGGIQYLHVVDLDGARSKHIVNHKILERIAAETSMHIDFGGGIKRDEDVQTAFDCGAKQITLGSVAVDQPHLVDRWLDQYGPESLILGADCKHRRIATHGWLQASGPDVIAFIESYSAKGMTDVICTDIEMDGMLAGPSIPLYEEILGAGNIRLIASGGISSLEDLRRLKEIGCSGAIIGKAIYEARISIKELSILC